MNPAHPPVPGPFPASLAPFRLCIPVLGPTLAQARQALAAIAGRGCLAELRLDYLSDVDLPALLQDRPGPVLVTNRLAAEGGRWQGTEAARRRLLEEAVALGVEYVDLELAADPAWRREVLAHRGATRIILSWHDFTSTPGEAVLQEVRQRMLADGPDVLKLVTMAHQTADNLKLLALIPPAVAQGIDIIAFCMGPWGKVSRVVAPILGSWLTFATLARGAESAPGQLTLEELQTVWEILA